jgi:hypothetical protein
MLSKTLIGLEVAVALYYNYNNCSKEEEDHTKRLIVCQVYHSFSRFSRMLDVARRRADKDRGTFKGVATGLGPANDQEPILATDTYDLWPGRDLTLRMCYLKTSVCASISFTLASDTAAEKMSVIPYSPIPPGYHPCISHGSGYISWVIISLAQTPTLNE